MQGSWRITQMGADLNNNGVMDIGEMVAMPDSNLMNTTFHADGSGQATVKKANFSINNDFRWSVDEAAQSLTINYLDSVAMTGKVVVGDYMNFTFMEEAPGMVGRRMWVVYNRK